MRYIKISLLFVIATFAYASELLAQTKPSVTLTSFDENPQTGGIEDFGGKDDGSPTGAGTRVDLSLTNSEGVTYSNVSYYMFMFKNADGTYRGSFDSGEEDFYGNYVFLYPETPGMSKDLQTLTVEMFDSNGNFIAKTSAQVEVSPPE